MSLLWLTPAAFGELVFSAVLIFFLMAVYIFSKNLKDKSRLLGVLCAVLVGLMASFMTGTMTARGIGANATGGLAAFVIVLAYWILLPRSAANIASSGQQPDGAEDGQTEASPSISAYIRKKALVTLVVAVGSLASLLWVRPTISITTVPRYDPIGGVASTDYIAGHVSGVRCAMATKELRVVVYAFTTRWYIQPELESMIPVDSECNWGTWTHTGAWYSALLVRPRFSFLPISPVQVLPKAGPDVLASTDVRGKIMQHTSRKEGHS